jgi:hypothetical protein
MKTTPFLLIALLATVAPLARGASAAKSTAPVLTEVTFVQSDKFTDARDSYTGSDQGRDAILDQLREYIVTESRNYVPEGAHLNVSITDVDLAGDFEPWHGPRWDDIRIVKDIYPPRIALSFRLTDASGKLIKEGKRDLRDLAFMMRITMAFADDPLRHEKALLDDWFRDEFGRSKAR